MYYYAVLPYGKGKRFRKYLNFKNREDWKLFVSIDSNWELFKRRKRAKSKIRKHTAQQVGRPRAIPKALRIILRAAGYSVNGSKISRNRKTFFSDKSVQMRFSLLDPQSKELIKTPDNLRLICKHACALLKSANRLKIPKAYDQCFQEALNEFLCNT